MEQSVVNEVRNSKLRRITLSKYCERCQGTRIEYILLKDFSGVHHFIGTQSVEKDLYWLLII